MALLVLTAVLVGLALGSFANVVIARVPNGDSVVTPRSACPRCGHHIRTRHNVPVLGWLALRGRCFDCRAPISARYPVVEGLMGLVFGLVTWSYGLSWELGVLLVLAFFSVVLSAIDLDTRRLPNRVTAAFALTTALYLLTWATIDGGWGDLVRVVAGAAALGGLYFGAWFVYPQGMGFGDVKLAPVIGGVLAWFGWPELIVGGFSAFLWGAVAGGLLMLARKTGKKSAIPFGPWMFVGAWTGIVVGQQVANWYLDISGLQ